MVSRTAHANGRGAFIAGIAGKRFFVEEPKKKKKYISVQ